MKIKIVPAMLLAGLIILFAQCKKDNGGDDTPPTPTVTKDFSPITAGSTFTFTDITTSNGVTDTSNYTLTVTSTDTVVNSKTYRKLTGSDTTIRLRAKVGTNYYQLASLAGLGIAAFEDKYLNDSIPVNDQWSESTQPFTVPGTTYTATATLKYKIAAKGTSLSVSGTNYTDVINVQLATLSVTSSGVTLPIIATGSYYYARGFGLIQGTLNVPAQTIGLPPIISIPIPAYSLSQTLTASVIK